MKTILCTFLLALVLMAQAGAGFAQARTDHGQLKFFAGCAGRLSAQMEHQWLFDGAASERTKIRRAHVIDILDALMPPNQGRAVLNWRITAKMAQASLLTRATFNDDPGDAVRARRAAARLIGECNAALLS